MNSGGGVLKRLIEVLEDIVHPLQPHRDAQDFWTCSASNALLVGELAVGGGSRVQDEGFRVSDVSNVADQLDLLHDLDARVVSTSHSKGEDRPKASGEVFFCETMTGAFGKSGVVHPLDRRMVVQKFGHLLGIGTVPFHAQGEGFAAV